MWRLFCWWFGHKWIAVWESHGATADALICMRCGENGWRF